MDQTDQGASGMGEIPVGGIAEKRAREALKALFVVPTSVGETIPLAR